MFLVFFFQANLKSDNKEANGYYDFYTGYIYLYKTENRKKALEYLESAESKGYTSPLLYRRKGMCYFHLKQFHRAIEVIEKSIALNMEIGI